MRSAHTVTVTNSTEVELQWEASVQPYRRARGMDPDEGGDVEDVRLVLGPKQIASARKLLVAYFKADDLTEGRVEALVQDILEHVLDARNIQPDDDEFREAASEAGEPDPDVEWERREDR